MINGLDFNIENMRNIISDIVSMHTNEVWYELIGNWELIRLDDIYGGTRFHLIGHVSNIRLPFTLDIATGDPILYATNIPPFSRKFSLYLLIERSLRNSS